MKNDADQSVGDLQNRYDNLVAFARNVRSLAPITPDGVKLHISLCGGSVDKARSCINGSIRLRDPHEKVVGDDSRITGQIGGLAKRSKIRALWIDDRQHLARIRLNRPITRAGRPTNIGGSTSIHFSFEVIGKAHLVFGRRNAQGRKATANDHVIYLEREEAAADLLDTINLKISSSEEFLAYQEREDAVARVAKGSDHKAKAIFTNIPGSKADRIALFSAIASAEQVERGPSLTIDLGRPSKVMTRIQTELENGGRLEQYAEKLVGRTLTLRDEEAERAIRILSALGWRDRRNKSQRVARKADKFGICYDSGKSGHVQFRLVGELPHEIDSLGRVRIIEGMCEKFKSRGLPFVAVMHAPGSTNDDRNWHFHLVYHDRPVSIFDGTERTHLVGSDANGEIPASKLARKAKWLNEPTIQAQIGMWDFQVRASWKTKSRNTRHIYPFEQRKDRSVTRQDFVPNLRAKLCELTNIELERYGIDRRVDPLTHHQAGRNAYPGKKLFSADHEQELAGIPTDIGSANEQQQNLHRMDELEIEQSAIAQRYYVTDAEEIQAKAIVPDKEARTSILRELSSLRRDIARLSNLSSRAREVTSRIQSRPNAMIDRNCKLMLAEHVRCPNGSIKLRQLGEQVNLLASHKDGMLELAGDHFQISRDADNKVFELQDRVTELEMRAGLRERVVFDFDATETTIVRNDPVEKGACEDTGVKAAPLRPSSVDTNATRKDDASKKLTAEPAVSTPIEKPILTPHVVEKLKTDPANRITDCDPREATRALIDVVVAQNVRFDLERRSRQGSSWALVAILEPRDSVLHGLPPQIVLETGEEKARLIKIGREREAQQRAAQAASSQTPAKSEAQRAPLASVQPTAERVDEVAADHPDNRLIVGQLTNRLDSKPTEASSICDNALSKGPSEYGPRTVAEAKGNPDPLLPSAAKKIATEAPNRVGPNAGQISADRPERAIRSAVNEPAARDVTPQSSTKSSPKEDESAKQTPLALNSEDTARPQIEVVIATDRTSLHNGRSSRQSGAQGANLDRVGGEATKSADAHDEAQEVAAALSFLVRVRNTAVHVGRNKSGLVVPHESYWADNSLTERGLRDPAMQRKLVGMLQRQTTYLKRIHPLLWAHCDASIVRKGPAAMVEALPKEERAEAREWAKTGIWAKATKWLIKDGRELSASALEGWKDARANEAKERFAEAAKALRRHEKWPTALKPEELTDMKSDAARHTQMLAAQQIAAHQRGIS